MPSGSRGRVTPRPGSPRCRRPWPCQLVFDNVFLAGYAPAAGGALRGRDPDPDASTRAVVVRAARPEPEAKAEIWREIFVARTVPLQAYGPIGRAFWDPAQAEVLAPFAEQFLAQLPELGEGGMTATLATLGHLFPRHGVDVPAAGRRRGRRRDRQPAGQEPGDRAFRDAGADASGPRAVAEVRPVGTGAGIAA